jgi:hypothetical protein
MIEDSYLHDMRWMMMPKRLADVKTGDRTIDADGRISIVLSKTSAETPSELYRITFVDTYGHVDSYNADAGHVWPLDPSSSDVPLAYRGETEASTGDIATWTTRGHHPILAPIMTPDGAVKHWMVKSCLLVDDNDADKIKVQCLRVDSPTHTFLLASSNDSSLLEHTDQKGNWSNTDQPDLKTIPSSNGVEYRVDKDEYDEVMKSGVPTHNCGGPLTLDTIIPLADGTETTMGGVKIGDMVIGPDGPTRVDGVSQIMQADCLYGLTLEPYPWDDVPEWTADVLADAEDEYEESLTRD